LQRFWQGVACFNAEPSEQEGISDVQLRAVDEITPLLGADHSLDSPAAGTKQRQAQGAC
jgi:hypothetical protein